MIRGCLVDMCVQKHNMDMGISLSGQQTVTDQHLLIPSEAVDKA